MNVCIMKVMLMMPESILAFQHTLHAKLLEYIAA